MNRTTRRGSIPDSGNLQAAAADGQKLKCPKCKQYYRQPRIMPCGHRVCKPCIEYLQSMSTDGRYFHCPQPNCGRVCATTAESLRRDRELEHQAAAQRRRSQDSRVVLAPSCRESGCDSTDILCPRCPHCELPLCEEHFVQHSRIVRENCDHQLGKMKMLDFQLQRELEECSLHIMNINNLLLDNDETHKQLLDCVNSHFRQRKLDLQRIKRMIEVCESERRDLFDHIRDIESAITDALNEEDDDPETLQVKQEEITKSKQLASNMRQLPRLPEDVRFNHTPSDVVAIEKSIRKLMILQESLEVETVEDSKLTIECQTPRAHHAVLWHPPEDFCISPEGHLQRRTAPARGSRDQSSPGQLPEEVLLLTNLMKLVVLSLEGEYLGAIKVTGSSLLVVNWFDVSPDGTCLALMSTNERRVLLCDMDGSVRVELGRDVLPDIHSLCSVTLDDRRLMIVDPGNTSKKRPGCVWLLDGPNFDPQRARRIPLDNRKIYPTAVTCARGNFFVLANKVSAEAETALNELLAHDRDLQLIGDAGPESLRTAQLVCSDPCGRIFVSVTPRRGRTLPESCQRAEILVLDPLGRKVGSVSDPASMASCHGISYSERWRDQPPRLVVCDPSNNLVHVFEMAG